MRHPSLQIPSYVLPRFCFHELCRRGSGTGSASHKFCRHSGCRTNAKSPTPTPIATQNAAPKPDQHPAANRHPSPPDFGPHHPRRKPFLRMTSIHPAAGLRRNRVIGHSGLKMAIILSLSITPTQRSGVCALKTTPISGCRPVQCARLDRKPVITAWSAASLDASNYYMFVVGEDGSYGIGKMLGGSLDFIDKRVDESGVVKRGGNAKPGRRRLPGQHPDPGGEWANPDAGAGPLLQNGSIGLVAGVHPPMG